MKIMWKRTPIFLNSSDDQELLTWFLQPVNEAKEASVHHGDNTPLLKCLWKSRVESKIWSAQQKSVMLAARDSKLFPLITFFSGCIRYNAFLLK